MLAIAGQTAVPNGVVLLREPSSTPRGNKNKKKLFKNQIFFFQNSN